MYRVASPRAGRGYITRNVGGTPNMRLMVSPAAADSEDLWTVDPNKSWKFEKIEEGFRTIC